MFNKSIFPFRFPEQAIVGIGALSLLANETKKYGKKVLIITDPGLMKTGIVEKVKSLLEENEICCDVYSDVKPEPPTSSINECASVAREGRYDVLIGLGGGSSIDVCKGVSVLSTNAGVINDYFFPAVVPNRGLPIIAIPTTSGTGAEVTCNAVFVDEIKGTKMTVQSPYIMPAIALVDPELTLTCPPQLTAATGLDALAHAIESYTAQKAQPLTEMYALESIRYISKYLRSAVYNGGNIEARYGMSLGSFMAGVTLANAGINAVHAMAHSLGGKHGVPHGISNGLLLSYVMEYNMIADMDKFAKIAEAMGENVHGLTTRDKALKGVEAVKNLCNDVQIPLKISDLGMNIRKEDLYELIPNIIANTRSMSNNPRTLSAKEVEEIFLNAY